MQKVSDLNLKEQELLSINERFHFASLATSDIIWDWDLKTNNIQWAENFTKVLGLPLPADSTLPLDYCLKNFHPDDKERVSSDLAQAIGNPQKEKWECEFRYRRGNGSYAYVIDRSYIMRNEDGEAVRMIGAMHDITEQKIQQDLLALELRVFEINSEKKLSFSEVIDYLLKGIEAIFTQMHCSVLLLMEDNTIKHLASASFPVKYAQIVDGKTIGPSEGSCGTSMYFKKPVIVSDIENDVLWEKYKSIAAKYGFKACWSVPIINTKEEVLGCLRIAGG
jgi:PAS domain S-box-containing protein